MRFHEIEFNLSFSEMFSPNLYSVKEMESIFQNDNIHKYETRHTLKSVSTRHNGNKAGHKNNWCLVDWKESRFILTVCRNAAKCSVMLLAVMDMLLSNLADYERRFDRVLLTQVLESYLPINATYRHCRYLKYSET